MPFAGLLLAAVMAGPTVEDLSWMSGYWLSCEDGREVSETWSDPRGELMAGHGLTLAGGRTSYEALRIASHDGGLAYMAQPGGAPATVLRADEIGPGRAVFENDYPVNRAREIVGPMPLPNGWIPRGRDPKLEQVILAKIKAALFL